MRSTLHKQSFPPVQIPVFQSLYTHESHNVLNGSCYATKRVFRAWDACALRIGYQRCYRKSSRPRAPGGQDGGCT